MVFSTSFSIDTLMPWVPLKTFQKSRSQFKYLCLARTGQACWYPCSVSGLISVKSFSVPINSRYCLRSYLLSERPLHDSSLVLFAAGFKRKRSFRFRAPAINETTARLVSECNKRPLLNLVPILSFNVSVRVVEISDENGNQNKIVKLPTYFTWA